MGAKNLSSGFISKLLDWLRIAANNALWENKPEEAIRNLKGLEGLIDYSRSIPFFETWGTLAASIQAYSDSVSGGIRMGSWNRDQLQGFRGFLEKVHPRTEFESRMISERTRTFVIMRDFPPALRVRALSRIDHDPNRNVTPRERFQAGRDTLLSLVCPEGWLLQNQATSLDCWSRLNRAGTNDLRLAISSLPSPLKRWKP